MRAILFNIFGGITRCDDVASGIVPLARGVAARRADRVRLTGTNEETARKILADHGLIAATSMDEGVRTAIARAQEVDGVSILIDKTTRLLVQGITGRDGEFHTRQMLEYGTKVVAGVTPGKAAAEVVHGVPVFDTVAEAVAATEANTSVIYVPAPAAADAIYEAVDAGIGLVVCITEGVPVRDMLTACHYVARCRSGNGSRACIGPNCPGLISPGQSQGRASCPATSPGPARWAWSRAAARSTYEVVQQLTHAGLGQTTCLGIGGDPVIGTNFVDVLDALRGRPEDRGGGADRRDRRHGRGGGGAVHPRRVSKPVVAFIAGQTAPPGKRMGHAGAIISGGTGTAAEKMAAFEAVGVPVARIPSEIPGLIAGALGRRRSRGARVKPGGARRKAAAPAKRPAGKPRQAKRIARKTASGPGRAAARPARKTVPRKPSGRRVSRGRRSR